MALYVDSSALVKLVIEEPESAALRATLADATVVTCDLARTEVLRAARRYSADAVAAARALLLALDLATLAPECLETARLLGPPELRTLDAIHLTIALELGADLDAIVTYDARMADAAADLGLRTLAPT